MNNPTTRMTVYYDAIRNEDDDGFDVVTTEKTYWDQNHFVDDGSSGDAVYGAISDAMLQYGAEESGDSEYSIYDEYNQTVESLVGFLAVCGIDLVTDPTFSAWVNRA